VRNRKQYQRGKSKTEEQQTMLKSKNKPEDQKTNTGKNFFTVLKNKRQCYRTKTIIKSIKQFQRQKTILHNKTIVQKRNNGH
jgi:hypothetical protein